MSDIGRKEAIRRLERLLRCGDGTYEFEVEINTDDQKAIQLAVDSMKADEAYQLEYELTTKNDLAVEAEDCISRKQAIQDFCLKTCDTPNCRFRDNGVVHASCDEVDVLKRVPSVYPKSDNSVLEDIKAEIKVEYDREAQNHDSFDEYSEGRYDAFGFCLRSIDKHISKEVEK